MNTTPATRHGHNATQATSAAGDRRDPTHVAAATGPPRASLGGPHHTPRPGEDASGASSRPAPPEKRLPQPRPGQKGPCLVPPLRRCLLSSRPGPRREAGKFSDARPGSAAGRAPVQAPHTAYKGAAEGREGPRRGPEPVGERRAVEASATRRHWLDVQHAYTGSLISSYLLLFWFSGKMKLRQNLRVLQRVF